jgi:hypothetical protein
MGESWSEGRSRELALSSGDLVLLSGVLISSAWGTGLSLFSTLTQSPWQKENTLNRVSLPALISYLAPLSRLLTSGTGEHHWAKLGRFVTGIGKIFLVRLKRSKGHWTPFTCLYPLITQREINH